MAPISIGNALEKRLCRILESTPTLTTLPCVPCGHRLFFPEFLEPGS